MIIRNLLFLMTICAIAAGQSKYEVQEFTGTIKFFEPGYGLAYETLRLNVSGKEEAFKFSPVHGKFFLNKFKSGDQITVKVNVNLSLKENNKAHPGRNWPYGNITDVKVDDQWIELPKVSDIIERRPRHMFLDLEVKDVVWFGKFQIGVVFADGMVGHKWYDSKTPIQKGDIVSFKGAEYTILEGYEFPVPDVKRVFNFNPLYKEEGVIKSFLFKQNYVCIGMVVKTKKGKELRLSFPSNYAKSIQRFSEEGKKITLYFDGYKEKGNLLPGVHVVAFQGDTLKIKEWGFYGGADIKHDHTPVTIKGKITQINRSERGQVMNIIVGNDCYVEVDQTMEKQLGNFFTKGQMIEVSGDERIKADGEIYSKNYRIITPRSVSINGKNFLLGQQP